MLDILKNAFYLFIGSIGALVFAYFQGKKSIKNEQNEEIAKQVKTLNQFKKEVEHLSDAERAIELHKWKNGNNK